MSTTAKFNLAGPTVGTVHGIATSSFELVAPMPNWKPRSSLGRGSDRHVTLPGDKRCEQSRNILGVVLTICVHGNHEIKVPARRFPQAGLSCTPGSKRDGESNDPHTHTRCQVAGGVSGAIIDQPYRQACQGLNVVNERLDRGRFVQCWHDNGGVHSDRGREKKM